MTRVLVTGAAGFLGSHLVDALVQAGREVVGVDNLHRGSLENLRPHLERGSVRFENIDIRRLEPLAGAMRGVDTVYHLAAQPAVMDAARDADYTLTTNVSGTHNVLEAASGAGVRRLVFASSREVYGECPWVPVQEDAPLVPKNLYGASKVAGEALCSARQASGGLECQVLRFGNLYGPRDAGRVIPRWLQCAASGKDLSLFGGEQVLDFLWVDYAVEALIAAARVPATGPINVASGQPASLKQLAAAIQAMAPPGVGVNVLDGRRQEVSCFVAHVGRMTRYLGVTPPADPLAHLDEMAARFGFAAALEARSP